MQIKTSHVIWSVVALVVLGNGDRIAQSLQESAVQQHEQSTAGAERKLLRQQAREAQKRSAIALDRVKAGCIPIFDKETGKPDYFNAGEIVLDPETGQSIQAGLVCNSLGLTGEVVEGRIQDLVMVSPAHKMEYLGYFTLQGQPQ